MEQQETTTTNAPAAQETEQTVATGSDSLDQRLAAATAILEGDEPKPNEPEAEAEPEAEEKPKAEAKPERQTRRERREAKAKAAQEPKAEGEEGEEKRTPNVVREIAAEWAQARRLQQANAKRAAELEERAAQLEAERVAAREVASIMQHRPIEAVERLAKMAGIHPAEYLQRLQQAYIDGRDPVEDKAAKVAQEVAQLRAELEAERRQRAEEIQRQQYEVQFQQVHQQETANLTELAKANPDLFPALQNISDKALGARVADAVQFFLQRGDDVGRFEVLEALNNIVSSQLDEFASLGNMEAQASRAPAQRDKSRAVNETPSRSRNGQGRFIPTNSAAADYGSSRRALTVEERLAEAAKVLARGD